MRLTPAQHHQTLSPTLVEALGLGADVIDDAWQMFEILQLASQLMQTDQFDSAVAKCASADAQRDAIGSIDQTAAAKAEAAKNTELDGLAAQCHPRGLYLCAVEKVYSTGTGFRWGSPIAERLAEEVNRERELHPLAIGLNASPERIELALRAVSRAIGDAGDRHPTNTPNAAGLMPDRVWLDT
jgi:hypothetical protein